MDDPRILRQKLKSIISAIETECNQTRSTNRGRQGSEILTADGNMVNPRKHLENLMTALAEKRHILARRKQQASSRSVENDIIATRKKLDEVNEEIRALEQEKQRQEKTIQSLRSSPLEDEIQAEIAHQRKYQAELRRASTDLERQVRARQRVCAQLEDQLQTSCQVRSSRESVRSAAQREEALQTEIALFEEEHREIQLEICELKKLVC